ncbi:MAG: nucleoside-diphosphate sugar epimerase/dehydratase [Gammaproteobacteria bacterium]|nr:nucleoside-diphosphate sugar epimerase/dehydratase [Gammaproteobacteria bacterium]
MQVYSIPISRPLKRLVTGCWDAVLITVALIFAYGLAGAEFFQQEQKTLIFLGLALLLSLLAFVRLGLYRVLVLYMGLQSSLLIAQCVTIATGLLAAAYGLSAAQGEARVAILPIFWLLALFFMGGSRLLGKLAIISLIQNFRPKEPVIIYGAGSSGMQLLAALQSGDQYLPVAFVDDGHKLLGSTVHGVRVYGPNSLYELVESFSVRQILLAIPSATHAERKEILNKLEHLPVHVKTVPDMFDMVSGKVGVDEIRDVDIEDLLGRDIVPPDPQLLGACIKARSVLVTGAAGSIGSELCRQIVAIGPSRLVILDSFEYGLYELEQELEEQVQLIRNESGVSEGVELVATLGSVGNASFVREVMRRYGVETVYHVAAYKQVPMVESNVVEGVRNNVFGTLATARAAREFEVKDFVLISTDKAVRPTNYMGATKRFAEQVLQSLAMLDNKTRFSMVRFGNVLGSSGSVVPLFRRQISRGGPVTVTHPEVTRFFMTVQEAAQLVIQAGSMATGGDVFVLDMHEPIRIVDLAKKMVHLMGYDVKDENSYRGDIAIEYTGLRPGEKLYEELLIGESVTGTDHPKIMRAEEESLSWSELKPLLDRLAAACEEADSQEIRAVLMEAVSGFVPESELMLTAPSELEYSSRPVERATSSAKVTPLFAKKP